MAARIFAPHRASADVIPHGRPESARARKFTIARPTAPQTSGHGPRSKRLPETFLASGTRRPCLARSSAAVPHAIKANAERLNASAGNAPKFSIMEKAFHDG